MPKTGSLRRGMGIPPSLRTQTLMENLMDQGRFHSALTGQRISRFVGPLVCALLLPVRGVGDELPAGYYRLMDSKIRAVQEHLASEKTTDLPTLESKPGWRHFPHALLAAAVLFAKKHPANMRYQDPEMLGLAEKIGDVLAAENQKGKFAERLDHHRDLYMWVESYRLLEERLSKDRRLLWRNELEKNLKALANVVAQRADWPAYYGPFLITSPNHFSLWSSTLYLAGRVFGNLGWENLGARVMHRFAAQEQSPDGYWGEHDNRGPTTGYDYLTLTGVALYWEHSRDTAALEALRRSTDFHKYFTYLDGTPVEVINDRNRYWEVSPWGHFGFSHFPDGRRYAEFLTASFEKNRLSLESLGRIAQNALYYHEGPTEPIPQDLPNYQYRMHEPAGIRKTGPWIVCLSGLTSTRAVTNQFFLDRQSLLSIFHRRLGLVVTGANSKRQPELATLWEKIDGEMFHLPQAGKLRMGDEKDQLGVAYNSFFSVVEIDQPSEGQVTFRFKVVPKARRESAQLNLQLVLKNGETLVTEAGQKVLLKEEAIDLGPESIGGWIRHRGWTLKLRSKGRLTWPVFPYNPYANAPVKRIEGAVGLLSIPITAQRQPKAGESGEEEIVFLLSVD